MTLTEDRGATSTVGSALAAGLARAGVKMAFTVAGESVLGLLDGLAANRIRVVSARHEGAASFMALAVAQLTGRPAVCIGARGPGAANLAIGLHAAQADSAPIVAIVGGVSRDVRGREAFQEMDLVRFFEPIVKWAAELRDPDEAGPMIERALLTATRGRPGPVLLAVPSDLFDAAWPGNGSTSGAAIHPEYHAEPDPSLVRKVLHLLVDARRPLILAGAGILRARATDALVRFADMIRVPVVASWRRPDVFPNDNPLYLGMTGLGAPVNVAERLADADAILVLGSRLGEFTSFGYRFPAPGTRWALVDIEPHASAAGREPEITLAADVAAFLRVAQRLLGRAVLDATSFDARTEDNARDREAYEAASRVDTVAWDGPGVHPGHVVATLGRVLPPESIITTDAGDFGTWAARGYRFRRPGTFLGSTAGPMGFALPAAIGATLARPGRLGVALAGDGGFAMTMAELETAVREHAHVIALVFDNGRLGTVWRHQEERASGAGLGTRLGPIDFAAVGSATGVMGLSVASDDEFEPALQEAIESGRPAVLHLALDPAWTIPDRWPYEAVQAAGLAETEASAVVLMDSAAEALLEAAAEPLVLAAREMAEDGASAEPAEPVEELATAEEAAAAEPKETVEELAPTEEAAAAEPRVPTAESEAPTAEFEAPPDFESGVSQAGAGEAQAEGEPA